MELSPGAAFMDPLKVISHFHIRPGDIVADFGAGDGHYLEALSKAVGQTGAVYACEIQKSLIERVSNFIRDKHLSNVHPLWCDLEAPQGIKLRDGFLDSGILINTFFLFEDKKAGLVEIGRVLRKGGRLFVIDWTDSFGGIGPHPSQVVSEATVRALGEESGYAFERMIPAADHHYGVVLRKL